MLEDARLGIFWFVPAENSHLLLELSRSAEEVDLIAGFRTLEEGHVDVWPQVSKVDARLSLVGYEYFPRGRVNWREDDGKFLLLADRYIFTRGLHQSILERWRLPTSFVLLLTDAHYRSQPRPDILR